MKKYCDTFDLHINVNKTKILFFSRGKLRRHHIFNFGNFILDTVEEYNYFGLVFNYNAKFKIAKSYLYQKGCRAMFALLKRSRNLPLPIDIMLELFNVLVKPVVLYGAEVWGSEKCGILERLQLRFFKYVLSVNKFTSSMMVNGELGATPLDIDIKSRMLTFLARLCSGRKHKISYTIYSLLYTLDKKDIFKSEWIGTVKTTLNNFGFSGLWLNQSLPCSIEVFKQSVKIRLRDQFIQRWHETISQGGKCTIYRIIKTSFGFENYLNELPDLLRKYFTKFRCRNHRLPIEAGARSQVLRDMRMCQFCEIDIGDEFHYLLCCPTFKEERKNFINSKYYRRPSTFYLYELFYQTKGENLKKLAMFVKLIICKF